MGTTHVAELSASMQMYLKSAFEIQNQKGAARVTDIADRVGVNKASVTSALRTLRKRGLLNYEPYDVITLTPAGAEVARGIERRFQALRMFFTEVLGIDAATAEKEACNLEHHLSPVVHGRLTGFIDYYSNCSTTKFRWQDSVGGFCIDPDDE